MRVIHSLLLLLILLDPAARAEPGQDALADASPAAPVVVVLGDSLSAGYGIDVDLSWTALLQARLAEQGYEHRVVNASISGETTEGGATRIGDLVERLEPALVVVELGGNDGLRGFPPARTRENLDQIIQTAQASGAGVALLGIRIPPNYGPRYIEAFEGTFEKVATANDIPWIEFFMDGVALDAELMQADGIHPNAAAQPRLLDNAWPAIEEALTRGQ
jgi:acyl-CoA thioesterase-1